MTAQTRLERDLPSILGDLAMGPTPDYIDDVLGRTTRMRQRPAWMSLERWIPVADIASRPSFAPRLPWRTIGVALILMVLLIALAVALVGTRQTKLPAPFGPAANGPIAYAWMGDIFLRDSFAAQPRLLVGGPDEDTLAGFSRDGTRLAFFRKVDDSPLSYDLWVAVADGSAPTRLAGPFDRSSWDVVDWSPTGDLIAVSSIRHEPGLVDRPVIDLVRVDGSGATRLDVNIDAADPAWRPGEPSQLTFRGQGTDGSGIYLAAHDGSGAVRLAIDHDGKPGNDEDFKNLTWSPSGDRLTFTTADSTPGSSEITSYRLRVATVDPAGQVVEQHRVTSSTSSEYEYQPAWTPGGDQIIFHRNFGMDSIVLAPAAGGPIRDLGLVGTEFIVSVSPDGTRIMALDHSSLVVKEIDLATGAITDGFSSDWSTVQAPTSQRLAP